MKGNLCRSYRVLLYFVTSSSTRRFFARPSVVSLSATGKDSPMPCAVIVALTPEDLKKSATDWARTMDMSHFLVQSNKSASLLILDNYV